MLEANIGTKIKLNEKNKEKILKQNKKQNKNIQDMYQELLCSELYSLHYSY